jgi:hypothetical protein
LEATDKEVPGTNLDTTASATGLVSFLRIMNKNVEERMARLV